MTRLSVVAAGRHLRDVDGAAIALAGISFLGSRTLQHTPEAPLGGQLEQDLFGPAPSGRPENACSGLPG